MHYALCIMLKLHLKLYIEPINAFISMDLSFPAECWIWPSSATAQNAIVVLVNIMSMMIMQCTHRLKWIISAMLILNQYASRKGCTCALYVHVQL